MLKGVAVTSDTRRDEFPSIGFTVAMVVLSAIGCVLVWWLA